MMNIFSIGNSIRSRIATVLTPRFSRPDSLSIVSRQSDLRTYSAESSCETFSVGQSSPLAFPFKAKSQLAFSHQSVLPILILFLSLFMGVGNAWGALPSGWSQVTALSGIAAGDKIIIVTNDGNKYFNGTQSSGHFQTTSLSASAPASASAAGVIELVSTGTSNTYKLKLVSTNKYVTASKASSGGGVVNSNSDSDGWTFASTNSTGRFNAQYQASGKQAYCRSYNNGSFRTYSSASSGDAFQIYKYSSGPSITVSASSLTEVGYSTTDFTQQVKSFTVSGSSLTANVTVSAPSDFEVCKTADGTYASSVSFSKGTGTLSASTVYVRLKSGKTTGNYNGNITCSSSGASSQTVILSGSVPCTVTWKADGVTFATTYVAYLAAGMPIGTLPTEPDPKDYCGDAFYGWYDGEFYENASDAPDIISTSTKISTNKIYSAVFANQSGNLVEKTDELTRATTGITSGSSTYAAWTNKSASNTGHSNAVYAGKSAGGNDAIQLRTSGSDEGLVTTTTGGNARKVTVSWESHTSSTRTIDIYGKNTAYSSAADLFNANNQGTLLGSICVDDGTEFTITGNYPYIGIRSRSSALYLSSISIKWEVGSYTYSNYTTDCCTPLGQINGADKVSRFLLSSYHYVKGRFNRFFKCRLLALYGSFCLTRKSFQSIGPETCRV